MEALFFLLLLLGLAVLAAALRKKPGSSRPEDAPLPYRLKTSLLTPAERSFLGVLEKVLPEGVKVWPKVRLLDLLTVEARGSERQAALNRVQAKHLDFLLVRARDAKPLLAIELDDRSHEQEARQARDRFLERLVGKIGLPLARVRVKEAYTLEEVRRMVEAHLGNGSREGGRRG